MEFVNAIILGIVQGLTEFIPVSSSGHLIIARTFLGAQASYELAFDAVLQLATTLAVLVYFSKDLFGCLRSAWLMMLRKPVAQTERTLLVAIVLGTIPAVGAGLLLEDVMDTLFRSTQLVALSLVVGALIMYAAERFASGQSALTRTRGFLIGCFQALALVPGFSRSGMTIAGGLFLGLNREAATRFAFVLAFPILLGSGLKKLLDLYQAGLLASVGTPLLTGSVVSFVVGLAAIHFLVSYLKRHTLQVFIWYRLILAVLLLVFFV
ncbi:MAG: hypothetical protein RL150_673 [Candidatus Parcubacteria bacterium]|jgi:undecaprenyl-diphosphatase